MATDGARPGAWAGLIGRFGAALVAIAGILGLLAHDRVATTQGSGLDFEGLRVNARVVIVALPLIVVGVAGVALVRWWLRLIIATVAQVGTLACLTLLIVTRTDDRFVSGDVKLHGGWILLALAMAAAVLGTLALIIASDDDGDGGGAVWSIILAVVGAFSGGATAPAGAIIGARSLRALRARGERARAARVGVCLSVVVMAAWVVPLILIALTAEP